MSPMQTPRMAPQQTCEDPHCSAQLPSMASRNASRRNATCKFQSVLWQGKAMHAAALFWHTKGLPCCLCQLIAKLPSARGHM